MATARAKQISLQDTSIYHCVSRTVRRTFLCGKDKLTGISYEHRRGWVEDKLLFLGEVFAIDICAYVVMSNHTHIILNVDPELANTWSMHEVISRWHRLFKGTLLTQRYIKGETLPDYLLSAVEETASIYRQRLIDISWFMRILNESIARQANAEDHCTGRFWQGRFTSQALLDDAALLACMAYVDLNPIRAKMANTPEESIHTSVSKRIISAKANQQPAALLPFVGGHRQNMPKGIPFELIDYLSLVDVTGRCIREDKRGYIDDHTPEILTRLNICPDNWLSMTKKFTKIFHGAVGHEDVLNDYYHHLERKRRQNLSCCDKYLA
jgi:REP element-mobilizing transposase RayT